VLSGDPARRSDGGRAISPVAPVASVPRVASREERRPRVEGTCPIKRPWAATFGILAALVVLVVAIRALRGRREAERFEDEVLDLISS